MKNNGNKEWQTPQLTVLVRSKPEEAVLLACKLNAGTGQVGEGLFVSGCRANEACNYCDAPTDS